MRWGCVILLSVGFAVSLGQRNFSAFWLLAMFCGALLSPAMRRVCVCRAFYWGVSSVAVLAAPAVLHSVPYRRLPFGCCATFLATSACPAPALMA